MPSLEAQESSSAFTSQANRKRPTRDQHRLPTIRKRNEKLAWQCTHTTFCNTSLPFPITGTHPNDKLQRVTASSSKRATLHESFEKRAVGRSLCPLISAQCEKMDRVLECRASSILSNVWVGKFPHLNQIWQNDQDTKIESVDFRLQRVCAWHRLSIRAWPAW